MTHATVPLYLDTEFNGHGGELLSIALVAPPPYSAEWYAAVVPFPFPLSPWVNEHVLKPLSNPGPPICASRGAVIESLRRFLGSLGTRKIVVYSDWIGDFTHFTKLLQGPTYELRISLDVELHHITTSEPQPAVPHNALSDARALALAHMNDNLLRNR